jgi:diguanylate cyclase (GGDEF)-like protein
MFGELLNQEIGRTTRYGSSFALLFFDLRNFKSVNDTYGHAAGDDILRSVARASFETIRVCDIPCRTGGDEFAILLPQSERPGSEVLAERIVRRFEEYARLLAPSAQVGIDCGIAIFPEDGNDEASLFAAADRSLYASKQKAHDQSASRTAPPQVTAPRVEDSTGQAKIDQAHRDDDRPPNPPAPAVDPKTGEKVQTSDKGADARKFERIPLEGTPALGIVRVGGISSTVKVLDASRGGVCLLVDLPNLPETFRALLQVPMLPGGELTLHRIYSLPLPEGKRRVGCALTSTSDRGSA